MRAHLPFAALIVAGVAHWTPVSAGTVLFMHDLPGMESVYPVPEGPIACGDPGLTSDGGIACDYFRRLHNRAPVAAELPHASFLARAHLMRSIQQDKQIQEGARALEGCEEAGECATIYLDPR